MRTEEERVSCLSSSPSTLLTGLAGASMEALLLCVPYYQKQPMQIRKRRYYKRVSLAAELVDSGAHLLAAINYIQHLEQAVRASGGKIENAVKSAASNPPQSATGGKAPSRKKKSSLSTSTSEVTSPIAESDTSPQRRRSSGLDEDTREKQSSDRIDLPDDVMSPIRDAVEDMAVDMEMSEEEVDQHSDHQTKEKRGALYMLGSVASAAAAAFDSTRPPSHSMRNRLGFLKGNSSGRVSPQETADVVLDRTVQGKESYDELNNKVVGAMWEHVENRGRVYRS